MQHWKDLIVSPETPIIKVIEVIDETARGTAVVVDNEKKLCGTVSDGDIRRSILRKISMETPVCEIMNNRPITGGDGTTSAMACDLIRRHKVPLIPIVNEENKLLSIEFGKVTSSVTMPNAVVLMAGGLGTRLGELTWDCPKPLLKVGQKPLLEIILERFIEQGFKNFYISVNYLADQIKAYFDDGAKWGVSITYLHEQKRLGTAGALSLLTEELAEPFFVMNGDILTKVDFTQMLDFHKWAKGSASMAVTEYSHRVPYGVVSVDRHSMLAMEEKPLVSHFISAGIYLLNPELLSRIPVDKYYDMPSLFETLLSEGDPPNVFPLREYWLDVGHLSDYQKANAEFENYF